MPMTYEEERTLRSLASRAAIADLGAQQRRAFEEGDRGTWLGTFVVEGVLEVDGQDTRQGHGPLAAWLGEHRSEELVVEVEAVVRVEGVRATQESRLLVLDRAGTVRRVLKTSDELVYERGRWYFARRRVAPA